VLLPAWDQIKKACAASPIGKRLPDALYVHESALPQLDPLLQTLEKTAHGLLPPDVEINLIKFHLNHPQISYLHYPHFDTDPHPALDFSFQVNLTHGTVQRRDYGKTSNPPILHRKETFIAPNYPHFADFAELTRQEETLGLLQQSRHIGTRLNWQKRLQDLGLEIQGHVLACPLEGSQRGSQRGTPPAPSTQLAKSTIDRHRAALHRPALSKPVRLAVEAGLLPEGTRFFDYGCGRGGDVLRVAQLGCIAEGWDPYYQPDTPWLEADVVNLGYIINVIEDPEERRNALVHGWQLTRRVLIVAAQVLVEDMNQGWLAYGDGVITSRNTFQKYYEQEELKAYIDQVLAVDAIPVALGIYFVFRDPTEAERFRASRFRSRATTPRVRTSISRFEAMQSLLQPLMDFYAERGRLPLAEEVAAQDSFQALITQFSSLKRAFNLVIQATSPGEWDAIRDRRRQDWLVYLALSQFGQRPRFSDWDQASQRDLKALFGSYRDACGAADLMLMGLGDLARIRECGERSSLGQLHPDSLWIHRDLIESLDPLLRLYEGCGARIFGRPEGATIARLHWKQAAVTYYTADHFETDPHPVVVNAMKIDLKSARVNYWEYDRSDNPPILVRKEQLVGPDHPLREKFAKLTRQEVQWGVLESRDRPCRWWTQRQWQQQMEERGAMLKGHRLVWRKDLDPYHRRILESQQRSLRSGDLDPPSQ